MEHENFIKNITSKDYGYYTLSNKIVAGTYSSARLRMSLKSSDGTSNIMDTDIKEKTTVNIAQNTGDLKVWCEVGVVLNNIRIYPKLEKGRTATEYYGVSYINVNIENNDKTEIQDYLISVQQPMRSIGDIRDTFIKKNGKRYERHWINRIESYNGETITTAYISNTGVLSNGAIVDYVLNEPLDLECTEEQNKVLNEIEYNSKTYQGITHIYSSDEISPYLEIRYVKDISKVLNNV